MIFISVIITAYNRKEYLIKAVKSVLNQSLNRNYYEIIVIKNFIDDKIDSFLLDNNIKNIIMDGTEGDYILKGMEEATGEIISFLDDDDIFHHEKLEYLYKIFNEHPDLMYFHNAYLEIDDNDNLLELNVNSIHSRNFNDFIIDQNDNKSIIFGLQHSADFNLSSISVSKSIKNKEYIKHISRMTDTSIFYLALANNGTVYISSKRLTKIRFHVSTSRLSIEDDESLINSFKKSMPTVTLEMMNDYFQNYSFYPIIKCNFYSNILLQQLIENSYSNLWRNIRNFAKCSLIINPKERFPFLILYIISYLVRSNIIFIKIYSMRVNNFRSNNKILKDN